MNAFRKVGPTSIRVSESYKDLDAGEFHCHLTLSLSSNGIHKNPTWLEKNTLNMLSEAVAAHYGVKVDWPHPDEE